MSETLPRAYAAWLEPLDRFQRGEDDVIPVLEAGEIAWSPGVAERWTKKVCGALEARLQALSTQLQKDLGRAAGDRHAIGRAMLQARRNLVPLARFCKLPAMPDELRSHLCNELDRWVRATQADLEAQAARDRRDQGLLLSTLRASRLEVPAEPPAVSEKTSGGVDQPLPVAVPRPRRILE